MGAQEAGRALEQQRVAGLEHDLADLAGHALAVAVHGDDRGVVDGAEVRVADALVDQRRRGGDHGFDESVLGVRARGSLVVRGRDEAANAVEIDDRRDHAREDEPVARADDFVGTDRCDDAAAAPDLDEE